MSILVEPPTVFPRATVASMYGRAALTEGSCEHEHSQPLAVATSSVTACSAPPKTALNHTATTILTPSSAQTASSLSHLKLHPDEIAELLKMGIAPHILEAAAKGMCHSTTCTVWSVTSR